MMKFLKELFKGFVIGVGAIVPGVSGGVIAAVLGLYEPIMNALSHFFHNIRKNFTFLLPYAIGGGIGFLLFSRIIGLFMKTCETEMLFLFSGLVIGGIPALIREADKYGFKKYYLLFSCAAFIFVLIFGSFTAAPIENPYIRYFSGGCVYSFGTVIPGISASFILINMGIYTDLLLFLHHLSVAVPFLLGFVLMSVILIKAVSFVFAKFHAQSYYSVIGFLSASIFTAFSGFSDIFLDICLFAIGIFVGFFTLKSPK